MGSVQIAATADFTIVLHVHLAPQRPYRQTAAPIVEWSALKITILALHKLVLITAVLSAATVIGRSSLAQQLVLQ
jgi:hypothetical protein